MKLKLAIACLLASVAMSGQVKKVAILETVDKKGDLDYAVKLMLRSNLAKAITNTAGYEAYDRTDVDAIMGEQDFQRTGMVSDDQIRRLGEMTGADYILVAEAVLAGESNMFITAKILDVESARTEMTDNALMGVSPSEIQKGCEMLANTLLKKRPGNAAPSQKTSSVNASVPVTRQPATPAPKLVKEVKQKAPKAFSDRKMLLGVNLGGGFDYMCDYVISAGVDFAYPLSDKFGLGAYASVNAEYDIMGMAVGVLSTVGKEKGFTGGLGASFGASIMCNIRGGYRFKNGLYLMGGFSAGTFDDYETYTNFAVTAHIGYNFGKFIKLRAKKK
ncbi:MAG: autotransporter outer membrane beta-barrel domain-containing protein [Bacteroidales bacterium]|nr:autotransporter outer membrane beta-barrel domain-containing protein [Bacteroidales bacterium]